MECVWEPLPLTFSFICQPAPCSWGEAIETALAVLLSDREGVYRLLVPLTVVSERLKYVYSKDIRFTDDIIYRVMERSGYQFPPLDVEARYF